MILGVTVYPLTPDPNDNLRAYMRERETYSFADVQVFGKYPDYLLRYFEKNGIDADITPADLEVIKNTVDFVSFSYYSSICETTHEDMSEKTGGNLSRGYKNPYLTVTEWGWQIDPVGLRITLNKLYDRYRLPLFIAENGIGAEDTLIYENGEYTVDDDYRINYLSSHLKQLELALDDGVNVFGYTMWAPIDLVSASTAEMRKRYGIVYVDRQNDGTGSLERYRKKSFYWMKQMLASMK